MGSCCGRPQPKSKRREDSGAAGHPVRYQPPPADLGPPYGVNTVPNDTGTLGGNVRGYVPQVQLF